MKKLKFLPKGSYECVCAAGYEIIGANCEDRNECLIETTCPKTYKCENTDGSFFCACIPGYEFKVEHNNCFDIGGVPMFSGNISFSVVDTFVKTSALSICTIVELHRNALIHSVVLPVVVQMDSDVMVYRHVSIMMNASLGFTVVMKMQTALILMVLIHANVTMDMMVMVNHVATLTSAKRKIHAQNLRSA